MSPPPSSPQTVGVDVISPRDFKGKVDFRKVHFTYPTRPDMHVLSGLDLTLRAGEVTALVRSCCSCFSSLVRVLSQSAAAAAAVDPGGGGGVHGLNGGSVAADSCVLVAFSWWRIVATNSCHHGTAVLVPCG